MSHFQCYSLPKIAEDPDLIFALGGELLPNIATEFGYPLPRRIKVSERTESQTRRELALHQCEAIITAIREMLTETAPHKTLQDNVAYAKEMLGENAFAIATLWLQRSGAMRALRGSFMDPTVAAPQQVDTVVFSGGMANWMERRAAVAKQLDPKAVGRILLPVGNRVMGASEHPQVRSYADHYDQYPTEREYLEAFIVPALKTAGFGTITVVAAESGESSKILHALFNRYPDLLEAEHQTLVVGNAPNTIQAAGQFRLAARSFDSSYDARGGQLFMMGDVFPIGEEGQPTWQAQNPISAVGQILRDFEVLMRNAKSTAAAA